MVGMGKKLYVVTDIPRYPEENSCYRYIVRATDYKEAIEVVKRKTGYHWEFDADLADNDEIWE